MNVSLNMFSISANKMLSVQDYEKLSAKAFAITKIQTFKHEPFSSVGGGGGGGGGGLCVNIWGKGLRSVEILLYVHGTNY